MLTLRSLGPAWSRSVTVATAECRRGPDSVKIAQSPAGLFSVVLPGDKLAAERGGCFALCSRTGCEAAGGWRDETRGRQRPDSRRVTSFDGETRRRGYPAAARQLVHGTASLPTWLW
jgi:hypothetical protein